MILNGIYTVGDKSDVHLMEITFDHPPEHVDIGEITQEVEGLASGSGQSPWIEKYLDARGASVVGDWAKTGFLRSFS